MGINGPERRRFDAHKVLPTPWRKNELTYWATFQLAFIRKRVLAPRHNSTRALMHKTRWSVIQCRITEPRPLLSETLEYMLIPKGGKKFEVTAYELKFIQDQWL